MVLIAEKRSLQSHIKSTNHSFSSFSDYSFTTFSSAFNCLQYDEICRLLENFQKIKSGDLTVKSLLSLGLFFWFTF